MIPMLNKGNSGVGRPREFDTQEALDKALAVFWEKGYEATSLQDLTRAMALSKSSFYDTFGSKHELFLAALDRYQTTVAAQRIAALRNSKKGAKGTIAGLFREVIEKMTTEGDRRGCFNSNCAAESAAQDPLVSSRVCSGQEDFEAAFLAVLRRGQQEGEIDSAKNAKALARFLASSLNGLILTAKGNPDPKTLKDIAKVTLSVLD